MDTTLLEIDEFAPYFTGQALPRWLDDPKLQVAFRLRFQVYCLECGFLPAERYPDRMESDEFDDTSAHFCSYDRLDRMAGYVRLVSPDDAGRLPFQYHGPTHPELRMPIGGDCAEISRLMVREEYRRRRSDTVPAVGDARLKPHESDDRRVESPQILLSLYRQMYAHSVENGIRYWYAAMERALARSLMRLNFAFHQIGPEVDYFGPVAPYMADLRELEIEVGRSRPALLAWMQQPAIPHD
jgi:N-acyl amino acid synthase of PEP-CTERM/exosortase system